MHCRLLFLVGQLGKGGLERQLCYLLQTINRKRYQPGVVVWNDGGDREYTVQISSIGIPIYAFSENMSRYEKLRALRRLTRELAPEVLHSYSFHTNFAAWLCAQRKAIPIGSIRNNFILDRRDAGKVLGRLSARWPAVQICNSMAAKQAVDVCRSRFKPLQVHVVRNRLDIGSFASLAPLPARPAVLAVGRLYPEKRWDRLIKVIALMASGGMAVTVRLAGDGPLLPTLRAQARRHGVEHWLQFLGLRSDIRALLADSTLLIHTADDEGCPNVVMEAMACGRAVVATDAGDSRHLIEDGETGFVVPRGDDQGLADRAMKLLADRDMCARMGAQGRKKAERDFPLHRLVSETLDAYKASGWRD